jgi:hypothetical protein
LVLIASETGITDTVGFNQALKKDHFTMVCLDLESGETEFTSGGLWVGVGGDHKIFVSQGEKSAPPPESLRKWGLWDRAKRPILVFLLREIPESVRNAGITSFELWAYSVFDHCCEGGDTG